MPVSAKYFCGAGIFILRDLSDLADGIFRVSFSEEKGNAPDSRKCDDRIDDAAEKRVLSAEDPGDKIELEKADATPVYSAYNYKRKCYFVYYRHCSVYCCAQHTFQLVTDFRSADVFLPYHCKSILANL